MKVEGSFGSAQLDAAFPALANNGLGLDPLHEGRLMRVLCESRLITRRTELVGWLQGDVRRVLPHQILIAAWGDFAEERPGYRRARDAGADLADAEAAELGNRGGRSGNRNGD